MAKKPDDFVPQPDFPEDHAHFGKPRCQAWSVRNDRQCLGIAMKGVRVCRAHGGLSPKGIGHYNYQGKGAGRYVPKTLSQYIDNIDISEILDLTHDLMTYEGRINQLLASLDDEDRPSWADARQAFDAFLKARAEGKAKDMARHLDHLGQIIINGSSADLVWDQIRDETEQRRRLIDTEIKRREKMRDVITAEVAMDHYRRLADAVKKHVKDQDVLKAIAEEFRIAVGVGSLSVSATGE